MSPEYFKRYLTFAEAALFIEGLNDRARVSWEQTRMLVNAINISLGGKGANITFPWDKEAPQQAEETTAADREELMREAKEIEKLYREGKIKFE